MAGILCLVDYVVLAALAERNRLRIIELLNRAPRWVGEIAAELGLRQPQVTKHLQTLQHAGLVTMHPLGRRRVYTLRREPLAELRQWLDALDTARPAEHTLERYVTAIASERAQAARDPRWAIGRRIRLQRQLPAPVSDVWAYWTSPAAPAAVAGIRPGWEQLLGKLTRTLTRGTQHQPSADKQHQP